ncbi:uncharacterized protein TM35_001271050, partial [Trypanosoma theileri]
MMVLRYVLYLLAVLFCVACVCVTAEGDPTAIRCVADSSDISKCGSAPSHPGVFPAHSNGHNAESSISHGRQLISHQGSPGGAKGPSCPAGTNCPAAPPAANTTTKGTGLNYT